MVAGNAKGIYALAFFVLPISAVYPALSYCSNYWQKCQTCLKPNYLNRLMSGSTIQRKRFLQTAGVALLGLFGLGKVKPSELAEAPATALKDQVHLHPDPRSIHRAESTTQKS